MKTDELITSLSQDVSAVRLATPRRLAVRLASLLLAYAVGVQLVLQLRPDLLEQLARPMFVVEVLLLALLAITSAVCAVLAMYPDMRQQSWALHVPYGIFLTLCAFLAAQLAMPHDLRMAMPGPEAHAMACALCIACVALIPSAIMFAVIRKGASVHPLRAGTFAVLAASGIGGLTLRLAEANDAIIHLITWHYVPTLLFASLGALLGKWLLKW